VTGEQLGTFEFSDTGAWEVAYSLDGRLAAASFCTQVEDGNCTAGEIEVRFVESGERVYALRGDPEYPYILSLAFSPDGRTLLTGHSGDIERTTREQIWRWNMSNGGGRVLLEGEVGHVYELRVSPNGETFAANINVGIRLLDVRSGEQLSVIGIEGNWPSFEFSPDGSMVAVGYCEETDGPVCALGGIMLWDLAAEQEIAAWIAGVSLIRSMAFSPDGTILASGACSQRRLAFSSQGEPIQACTAADITLWSTIDGALIQTFGGHTSDITGLAFSPDGTRLFSASFDGAIRLWQLE
jgi:WD40 repeat protein